MAKYTRKMLRAGNITHTGAPSLEYMAYRMRQWLRTLGSQYTTAYSHYATRFQFGMVETKSQPQNLLFGDSNE